LRSPFHISATTEASDFKFGIELGFAKAHYKITQSEEKWVWPWARGFLLIFLKRMKIATSGFAGRWVLPRPIKKSHSEEKVRVVMG